MPASEKRKLKKLRAEKEVAQDEDPEDDDEAAERLTVSPSAGKAPVIWRRTQTFSRSAKTPSGSRSLVPSSCLASSSCFDLSTNACSTESWAPTLRSSLSPG